MIYLDHNATAPPHPKAIKAVNDIIKSPLNPSSIHSLGRKGKSILEQSRLAIAELLGFDDNFRDYQVVFTSSGTEANNLVLNNFKPEEIFIAATEHHSIYSFKQKYANVNIIRVLKNGILDLDHLEELLCNSKAKDKLVSVMLANNESGIIQPIKKIANLAHKYTAYMHSDCVQAIGKMKVNITDLNLDFMSISAHKFGGIIGAGALIYHTPIKMKASIIGGGQERGMRSGTENITAIASMGAAAGAASEELDKRIQNFKKLQGFLEKEVQKITPDIEIIGQDIDRIPNTSLIINNKKAAQLQIINFDRQGVFISSGSACSSGKVGKSHVLSAMGYSDDQAKCAIRISSGVNTSEQDIKEFLTIYKTLNE
ncbi:MAG: hypothetical protein DGJ47_000437 [Rickettsiaceae bacterium]